MATRLSLSAFVLTALLSPALAAQMQPAPAPAAPAPKVAPPAAPAPKVAPPPSPAAAVSTAPEGDAPVELSSQDCDAFVKRIKEGPNSEGAKLTKEQQELLDANPKGVMKACTRVDAELTSGGIGTTLLRTAAQVVVDKVQRQGWVALKEELKTLAQCPDGEAGANAQTPYPSLCGVLDTATIQDLVSSPEVLLDAIAADLLARVFDASKMNPEARDALAVFLTTELTRADTGGTFEQIGAAHRLGAGVLLRRLQRILLEKASEQAGSSLECRAEWTSPEQALWVAGMCFAEQRSKDALSRCDFNSWLKKCGASAKSERVLQFLASAQEVLGRESPGRAEATVRLVFGMARAQATEKLDAPAEDEALRWLAAFEDMLLGLVNRDWVRVVSGGTRAVSYVVDSRECRAAPPQGGAPGARAAAAQSAEAKEKEDAACEERVDREQRLLHVVAAIGNYALTYKNEDEDAAQADREKIMGELVDRMVSRTSKTSGVKLSLGGSLGVIAGARASTDFKQRQVAFPAQLGLGFGLQSYGRGDAGFHLMATVFDLGQYVTFENSMLEVEEPDVEAAVTLGLTLGAWVWNRELPYYVAGYFGCSPFVRAEDGGETDPTLQFGVVTGFYAPLLDFN